MSITYITINGEIYPFTPKMIDRSITLKNLIEDLNYKDFDLNLSNEKFKLIYDMLIYIKPATDNLFEVIDLISYLEISELLKKIKSDIALEKISVRTLIDNYENYINIPDIKSYAVTYIFMKDVNSDWEDTKYGKYIKEEFNKVVQKALPGFDIIISNNKDFQKITSQFQLKERDVERHLPAGAFVGNYIAMISPSEVLILNSRGRLASPNIEFGNINYTITWFDLLVNEAVDADLLVSAQGFPTVAFDKYLPLFQKIVEDKYNVKLVKGDQVNVKPYNEINNMIKFVLFYNGSQLVYPKWTNVGEYVRATYIFPGKDFVFPQDKIVDVFGINKYNVRIIDDTFINLFNDSPITKQVREYIYKDINIDGEKYTFIYDTEKPFKEGKSYYITNIDKESRLARILGVKGNNTFLITSKLGREFTI